MNTEFTRRKFLGHSAAFAAGIGAGCAGMSPAGETDEPDSSRYYILPPPEQKIEKAPASIVRDSRLVLGYFDAPVREMNLEQAALLSGTYFNFPQFIGYGIAHPEYYFGTIIIDSGFMPYVGSIYAYNRKTGELFAHGNLGFGWQANLARTTYNDDSYIDKHGFRLRYEHRLDEGCHRLKIDIAEYRGKPSIKGELRLAFDLNRFRPLTASLFIEPRHWCYMQKAHLPIEGELSVGGYRLVFDPQRDLAGLDESRNLVPSTHGWIWGAAAGYDSEGRMVAFNAGVRSTISDRERWSENCIWIDGQLQLLGGVKWQMDDDNPLAPWKLTTGDGRLDLEYHPEGMMNVGAAALIGAGYWQTCGKYIGTIRDEQGRAYAVDSFYGVAEQGLFGSPTRFW